MEKLFSISPQIVPFQIFTHSKGYITEIVYSSPITNQPKYILRSSMFVENLLNNIGNILIASINEDIIERNLEKH